MMIGSRNGFMVRGSGGSPFDPYSLSGMYVAGTFSQTFTDEQKDQIGLNAGFRYKLLGKTLSPTIVDGDTVLSCQLNDYAINIVTVSSDTYPVIIQLPSSPADSRARDFLLRLEITSSQVPQITIDYPSGEDVEFESLDDWSTFSTGVNLLSFTETKNINSRAFVNLPLEPSVDLITPTIAFSPDSYYIDMHSTQIVQTYLNTNSDGTVTYQCSDTSIATVDSNGLVTISKPGTVTITATVSQTETYKSGTATCTVNIGIGGSND